MAISLSPWVIKCIDKRRRAFLWAGSNSVSGGKCLLAWPKVCRPPELGGLGFLDLNIFGYSLRMRWLWFKKTDPHKPWAGLPDSSETVVAAMFHASVSVQIGDGKGTLFWSDRWLQGKSVQELAPCLFNAVGSRVVAKRTVAQGLANDSWVRDIKGALTVQILKKARAPGKCKFFTWLALHDRCWTAERRKHHNLQDTDTCVLCAQESETIAHLLVGCSFSREVWYRVLLRLRWYVLTPDHRYFDLADWWNASRKKLQKAERKCFDSLVILISWLLWNERNRCIFDKLQPVVSPLASSSGRQLLLL
ncbi:hypothetical protein PVAP13_9NG381214 [Panicum virgatum]|uniref:Reverse transcriptase zinc-binding domain-containing protein n=1 Tax=Panicum virgatum TaxID=38727 RepID=A0A8T0MME4_PANVG|nr:hypothetical protein PVAP13_9NG381214 [Panicum virgatum]